MGPRLEHRAKVIRSCRLNEMFGTVYFGQIYFAGVVFEPTSGPALDDCGGMFGTATFGQPYFGQHIQCGNPVPPPPPPPPPPFIIGGGGAGYFPSGRTKKKLVQIIREKKPIRDLSPEIVEDSDDDEAALIVSSWLRIK